MTIANSIAYTNAAPMTPRGTNTGRITYYSPNNTSTGTSANATNTPNPGSASRRASLNSSQLASTTTITETNKTPAIHSGGTGRYVVNCVSSCTTSNRT